VLQFAVATVLVVLAGGFAFATTRALRAPSESATDHRHRFLVAYDAAGFPADLLVQCYEQLTRRSSRPGRAVTPEARLAEDLGMSETDVEDAAVLVLARAQGRVPAVRDLDRLDASVRTVDDLVRLLAELYASETRV
jgi:hypothetical protein